jgi:hypothetical protein
MKDVDSRVWGYTNHCIKEKCGFRGLGIYQSLYERCGFRGLGIYQSLYERCGFRGLSIYQSLLNNPLIRPPFLQ